MGPVPVLVPGTKSSISSYFFLSDAASVPASYREWRI